MATIAPQSLALRTVNQECKARIGNLAADMVPNWGRMTAAQMMAHCAEVLEVANGKEMRGTPWFIKLMKPFVRRAVVSAKPYPRDNMTHPQYVQTGDMDFDAERARLLKSLEAFAEHCAGKTHIKHPFFGEMTVDEAGWAMFKHLEHHLKQFGV